MHMKFSWLIFSIPVLLTLNACHQGTVGGSDQLSGEERDISAEAGEIIISREQFESMEMEVGDPSTAMFSTSVSANGYIVAAPSGRAKITSLISGRVRHINVSSGDQVRSGQTLFSLESHEIIQLQQEYAVAVQHLKLLKADYERYLALSEEKIVAEKDFLKAESEFRSMEAKAGGLKSRLEMIHIDPSAVENGKIVPYLAVNSPISGTITRQELVLGKHVVPLETTMEVIDEGKLRLRLEIFETSMADLRAGQEVKFYTPNRPEQKFTAILSHVGKSVAVDSRTVDCFATIAAADRKLFVNNMYVEASILTCQREALAIPEQALIREPDRDFVLILVAEQDDQMTFRKIPVQTGVTRLGQTEILDENLTSVLLEGVFSLWTEE
jgi:cobalt-zinc-cadmium efflux system membrane fusion protein